MRDVLDEIGRFKFGKCGGKVAEYVAREDAGYLRWFLENVEDIDEDDRKVLESLYRRFNRG